jgi:choline dehydrogenase-like flavoprotein
MYDYVIVGAGSAGCVLANRLTEDPDVSVLLLEAGGPDTNELVHLPAAFSALYRSAQDWDHSTIYEPYANDRRIYLPRGKVLGGSSSINALVYMRGNPLDYDGWGTGWTWDDLLPYFKRSEDNERGESEFHGAGGPLSVSEGRSRNPLTQAFLDSAAARGLPANEDFNDGSQDGVGWYQVTERNGARCSTAVAYLHPVMRRANLTVETHVHALSILFEAGRAVGVVGARLGEMVVNRAEREVIVCCGTYNSPQLLMLSGIGRPAELQELQIEVVAESPEIGLNLHDHPQSGAVYGIEDEISLYGALNEENLALFEAEGRGPLTSNIAEAGGFMRTRNDLPAPDIQFHFAPARFQSEGLVPGDGHGFALGACLLTPKSRGFVALGSPDPTAKPLILHNYLMDPDDVAAMVAGVRASLEICATGPLGELSTGMLIGPASSSDEDIEEHCRQRLQTLYHPVGTCRMGDEPTSVVDRELKVRGVEGLRVVDASVMPTVPRGNTNAPVIALAERAADLIRGEVPVGAQTELSQTEA